MAKWRTICLLWLSSCLLSGCYVATNAVNVMDAFTNCPPVFKPVVRTATYKAELDFYKKHISGLFVFKAMNDTTERVVFMTEMGFKFFDFEFTPHTFKVQYIIPGMDKKIIVNTLHKDLGYLTVAPIENSKHEQPKSDMYTTFKFPEGKNCVYYSTDKKCNQLQKIEVGNDRKKNLVIDLTDAEDRNPRTINIAHKNFKLTIAMKKI